MGNFKLHLTSTVFDAPFARDIVRQHDKTLSVHGYEGDSGKAHMLIGGQTEKRYKECTRVLLTLGSQHLLWRGRTCWGY